LIDPRAGAECLDLCWLPKHLANRIGTTRGFFILIARLNAREQKSFLHFANFAITKQLWENESCYVGRNEMAGLKGKSGPPGNMNAFKQWKPLASSFLRARQALQDHARWRETLEQMLTMWLSGAPASVDRHIRNEMESHSFEDWARAGREISAMYAHEGDPLQALSQLSPPVPLLHVYVEARAPEYLSAQESFAREHSWFHCTPFKNGKPFPHARSA
jgi:hypothetical protein